MIGLSGRALSTRWLRRRLPARTIRMRLTLVYGGLFLLSGAALLAITYVLVRHEYTGTFFITSGNGGIAKVLVQQSGIGVGVHVKRVSPTLVGPAGLPSALLGVPPKEVVNAAANASSDAALHQLVIDSGIALAVMAVFSIWLGWLIAGRALRPLRTIANAAREISASNLHRRIDLKGPDDELKQLGTTFDGLLARLESSFDAQRQFVANASHELRTPLTLERTLLELALSDPDATIDSYRHTCEQLLAVGEQQERLIEALLTLSRSQRGLDSRQPVDLAAIAAAAATAADHEGLAFETSLQPAETSGDPRLVERLVANLVSNAVQHNIPGGHVSLTTETRGDRALLTVANTGPEISGDELERIFQPFQRLGGARTADRKGIGLGLGLSIVKAIADAHGAQITADVRADGGLRIEVAFPALDDPGGLR